MKIKAQIGTGKNALITGGSSGIGYALAQILVKQGNNVILVARRKELLEQRVGELNTLIQSPDHRVIGIQADVADWDQVQTMARQVISANTLPDLIINSAGIVEPGYVQDLSVEKFHQSMAINYHGTVHVIKAFLPDMMQRKSGYIVNISSIGGIVGVFGYTAYSGSKFAVRGFTDALRWELTPHNIGVTIVYPSDTETPQLEYDNQHKPPETKAIAEVAGGMTADVVAKEVIESIRRGKRVILPGSQAKMLYLLYNITAGKFFDWVSQIKLNRVANDRKKS
jgi:3-dehydrosphinganine reductase